MSAVTTEVLSLPYLVKGSNDPGSPHVAYWSMLLTHELICTLLQSSLRSIVFSNNKTLQKLVQAKSVDGAICAKHIGTTFVGRYDIDEIC